MQVDVSGGRPASTPMEPNQYLAKTVGLTFALPDHYRQLIGKLIYLALTRPKLAYVLHSLAKFMQALQQHHWDVASE